MMTMAKPKAKTKTLEEARLESLINSMADGVLALSETGKILLYNGAALNILDIHGNIIAKKIEDICHLLDKSKRKAHLTERITSLQTQLVSRDYILEYPDGSHANLYISAAPVGVGFGAKSAKGFVLIFRDITHEKSLEEERDEFISVVSHELRTPITIAEGSVSNAEFILHKTHGNEAIKAALKAAHEQVLFLSGMINDLATLSRAERGKLVVDATDINAHDLLQELKEEYEPQAHAKHLKFAVAIDPQLELLHSSELYVREILQNFITNAIKYTEKGTVSIAASYHKNGVTFEVSDTGIGISKNDQVKVFEKFFRSEDYRTRANSGTGLGLYVTMKLTRLINAEISLESELDKGSTFSIFIPNL
jgi:two-component system phosphate regulon sensor histidine kinase PhoR